MREIDYINKLQEDIKEIKDKISKILIGRKVRVISDYNGQPHGKSKPKLTGKIFTITHYVDDSYVWVKGQHVGLRFNEFELLTEVHEGG